MHQIRDVIAIFLHRIRVSNIIKALSVSILNQVVSSGANFVLGIYLARTLTITEFGLYGVGFAILLLYSGVGNALFLTQMVVHMPDKVQSDKLPYAARVLIAVVIFCFVTAAVAILLLVFCGLSSNHLHDYVDFGIAITAASIAYLVKDFFVRYAYTVRNEILALILNISSAIVLAILLTIRHELSAEITSVSALLIYAISNIVSVVVGIFLIRLPILSVNVRILINDAREAWVGGKWALGGVLVIWLQTQAYMYITAIFAGSAGVGYANASRLLITPALFLMPAVMQILMPRLAELRLVDYGKMFKISQRISFGFFIFAILYSIVLLGFLSDISSFLFPVNSQKIASFTMAWCFVLIFQCSRIGAGVVLQVLKAFRMLMLLNVLSAVVAVLAAAILMRIIGGKGAVIGTALGELVLSALLFRLVQKYRLSKK